ncbi:hypothetical protein [Sorangium sp. So ce1078]|uniref:hypothetical protein n=1 Tax=Sorangium sp. So ce1078 TaxID=3133329 RepID=UPI003F6140AE
MRHLRQLFVCSVLAALTVPVGCGSEAPDGAEQASDVGSISLALVGTSVTGATYRLSRAWFDIYGPTTRLVYGDGDTTVLTEVLPVGRYDVYLEPGWVLERWTGSGYQYVPAALTSPNPTPVFISEGATSTVVFQFRADGDVVSVGQGNLDIVIGVDDTTPLSEDTDVACSNGYDDDGDGYPDCSDPDCQWQPFCAPMSEDNDVACSNGYDDDADGVTDCSDSDCQWQPYCAQWREDNDVTCSNGYDDDGDGYADCSDPECQWQPYCVQWREDNDAACSNGYDDDGDGYADCSDPECQGQPSCAPWGENTDWACSNGYDDDGDGYADCSDPECQWQPYCEQLREDNDVACSNGYDDDGDGYADCSDPECQGQPSCTVWGESTDWACSNGYDDDGDGLADCSDLDCHWLPFCAPSGFVIETFDDGDFVSGPPYASSVPPYTGPWATLSDESIPPLDMFPVPGPIAGMALGVRSPGIPSTWGAGVMLHFEAWPVDMSTFQGIRFRVRSEGSPVRFEIGTIFTAPDVGHCSDCLDNHGIDVWAGSAWTAVELRWWDLTQQGWGTPVPFEPWAIMNLSWRTPAGQPLGIEIDDVELF